MIKKLKDNRNNTYGNIFRRKRNRIFGIVVFLVLALAGCAGKSENSSEADKNTLSALETSGNKTQQFSNTDFVMDTVLNITLYGTEDLSSIIKENLQKLEYEELSWRESGSMASKINEGCDQGNLVKMDEAFASWTLDALELAKRSEGAFDPTIGKLTRLWNIEGENPKVPATDQIKACLDKIGYQYINIEENDLKENDSKENVISMKDGTSLDLGAIGKGIACDEVHELLATHAKEVDGAVVAVGGSIITYGEKEDGSPWNIAIQDPNQQDGNYMGVVSVKGTHYISTSGDYEKYFIEDGKRYHHILDPRTGYPSESGLRSVTILCDNGLLSDGLSTACFVLGPEKGAELAESYGAEYVFIDQENKVIVSEGMEDIFTILEDGYKIKE